MTEKTNTKTPHDWAKAKGHFRAANPNVAEKRIDFFDSKFAAADVIYGWSKHAAAFQDVPFLLSERDFDAAMAAAAKYPTARPHEAALPHSQAVRFADFQPLTSTADAKKVKEEAEKKRLAAAREIDAKAKKEAESAAKAAAKAEEATKSEESKS